MCLATRMGRDEAGTLAHGPARTGGDTREAARRGGDFCLIATYPLPIVNSLAGPYHLTYCN
jgi:hypothetical protein